MKRWGALMAAVLFLVPAFIVGAEPNPASFTSSTTGGVFDGDQDYYVSPTDFGRIEQPSVFLQFDMPGNATTQFRGGVGLPLGTVYAGVFYGAGNYLQGKLTSNQSTITNKSDTYATSFLTGEVVGVTKQTTVQLDYQNAVTDAVQALFGLHLGSATLGIYSSTSLTDQLAHGNYRLSYTLPGVASWSSVSFAGTGSSATATSWTSTDAGGTVTGTQSEAYALGQDGTRDFTQTLVGGFMMPLGSARLEAFVGVRVTPHTEIDGAAFEATRTSPNAGYAAFTPATFLPGATAAAVADATMYSFDEGERGLSSVAIVPRLGASVELPLPLPGNAVLTAGASVYLTFNAYSNPYMDTAGVQQPNSGTSSWFHAFQYTTGVAAPGQIKTTRTDTRTFAITSYGGNASQLIQPDLKVVFTPSDRFSFGIRYSPELSLASTVSTSSGSSLEVVTYEDGDGVDGNAFATSGVADPDDYVQTTTVNRDATGSRSSMVQFTNYVYTGAQFYLIPKRLRVNLGASVTNRLVDRTTTSQTTDSVVTYTRQQTVDGLTAVTTQSFDTTPATQSSTRSATGFTTVGYVGGLTFFFNENMTLDLSNTTPAAIGSGVTSGNIWDLQTWDLEMNIRL